MRRTSKKDVRPIRKLKTSKEQTELFYYFKPFSSTSFTILEKLTVDEVSLIFFDCNALTFFAISLFSITVILSDISNQLAVRYF